jgi:hypothetical protein
VPSSTPRSNGTQQSIDSYCDIPESESQSIGSKVRPPAVHFILRWSTYCLTFVPTKQCAHIASHLRGPDGAHSRKTPVGFRPLVRTDPSPASQASRTDQTMLQVPRKRVVISYFHELRVSTAKTSLLALVCESPKIHCKGARRESAVLLALHYFFSGTQVVLALS